MMDSYDFIAELNANWPNKEFDSRRWSERIAVKQLDGHLDNILNWMLDNCSFPPTLAKLSQAAIELGIQANRECAKTPSFVDHDSDCEECRRDGLVRVWEERDGQRVEMCYACTCPLGEHWERKKHIPSINTIREVA